MLKIRRSVMRKIKELIKNISPFNNRTDMPKILYILKVIIIFWVFRFIGELVGEVLALIVHFACGKNPLKGEMFDFNTVTLLTYLGYSVIIAVIILLWKLFQKKTLSELGFNQNFGSYFIGIAAGTVLLLACIVPAILSGSLQYNGVFANIDIKMVFIMIVCFMLQGAMEEVLCRGVVQQLLVRKTSVPVAVGVSAALFTIPHLNNMEGGSPAIVAAAIVNLILISLIFSLLTLRFKSIWAACGMHSFWNFILNSIMGLNLSGNDETVVAVFDIRSVGSSILNGAEYGIEASIITTTVLSVALGICIILYRRSIKKTFEYDIAYSGVSV